MKKIKNYLYAITLVIATITSIVTVHATTFSNHVDLNIADLVNSEAQSLSADTNNWGTANAIVWPSKDYTNGFSFDLLYSFDANGVSENIELHITSLQVPIAPQSIDIIYNKDNPLNIILLRELTPKVD